MFVSGKVTQVTTENPMNEVIVTARKLTDYEERLMFMPKFFANTGFGGNHTISGCKLSSENKSQYLSSALDKIEAHYDGGEWDFYELSNGGYFMAPNSREHFTVFLSVVITLTVC